MILVIKNRLVKNIVFCYNLYGDFMSSNGEYKITIKNFFGHLHTVNKHRFKVFCLCFKAGIPWRGFVHDLSKYSPVEFFEGVKYFSGKYSPIKNCKNDLGYSKAWLHHTGRNKHHPKYWYDYNAPDETPIMPYKYFVEMICDTMAAGITYQGKNWTKEYQLSYWERTKNNEKTNPQIKKLCTIVYKEIARDGLDKVINKKYLQELYKTHIK